MRRTFAIIPARKGSKGVPGKNTKILGKHPLVAHTILAAKEVITPKHIFVSTDCQKIQHIAKKYGAEPAELRPDEISQDDTHMHSVILHALDYFDKHASLQPEDIVILLQPTSPFRNAAHIAEAVELFNHRCEAVISVVESHSNPYFNLLEENESGWLEKSKQSDASRRQDAPQVFQINGAIYVSAAKTLRSSPLNKMKRIVKYIMSEEDSIDIDTHLDWMLAQIVFEKKGKLYAE